MLYIFCHNKKIKIKKSKSRAQSPGEGDHNQPALVSVRTQTFLIKSPKARTQAPRIERLEVAAWRNSGGFPPFYLVITSGIMEVFFLWGFFLREDLWNKV